MKDTNYVVIQGWMCNQLNLKGNDLLVFALIYGFSQDEETEFKAGRKYIADTFNISLPTVDKSLRFLLDKSYIIKHTTNDYVTPNTYKVHMQVVKNLYEGRKETLLVSSKETLLGGSKETLHNNIDKKESNKNKKDKSEEIVEIYHSICISLPKVRSLTDKRKKAIQTILKKGYTVEDLTEAFTLAESSAFMKGDNDRGWVATFDFFFREDKLIAILEGKYGGCKKSRDGLRGTTDSHERKAEIKRRIANGTLERI